VRADRRIRPGLRRSLASLAALVIVPVAFEACLSAPPPEQGIARLDGSRISADSLTHRIDELVEAAGVHGLTVTVFNDAGVVYSRAFGAADAPSGRPLTLDTEMYGASLSKAVFGVLVMKLVDRGVLDLDTPLEDLVGGTLARVHGPEWHEDFVDLDGDLRLGAITARMALSHTTGLPNWRWLEPDEKLRIRFDPGTRYSYSGEGMVLLQLAIRELTGRGIEDLMREQIFEPYGMPMSSYTWQPRFEAGYALGHRADGTTYPKDKDNAPRAPSTLETTPGDYNRFIEAVLRGDGLSAAARQEMFSPQIRIRARTQFGPGASEDTDANDDIELSYGLGWGLVRTPHGWGAFKEGHGDGFQHYSVIFPDSGLGVVLLSNSDNAESIFGHLLEASIANTWTPLEWEGYVPFDR
jgi:D-alanyl-D-alanine-carboxypeptidase/D-alanyl-D-alanine-endopeptidase